MNDRICVYTCITGDYDNLHEIVKEDGIEYLCFTNNPKIKSSYWKMVYIEDEDNLGNMLLSRKIKILGHPYLEQYDISIWVDGALEVKGKLRQFVKEWCDLSRYPMACFCHRLRNCVYDEARACIVHRKADKEDVIKYLNFLEQEEFPKEYGLAECTVLIRKENDLEVKRTMKLWFELLCKYVKRDQLSFPYSIWKTGLKIHWINLNVFDNPWFFWKAHKQKEETKSARIFFDEYKDVYNDIYLDGSIESEDNKEIIRFLIPKECSEISVNVGKHFGKIITSVDVSSTIKALDVFPGMDVPPYTVADYDDMVFYIKGHFCEGQKLIIYYEIHDFSEVDMQEIGEKLVSRYYYDKIIRDNMINMLNQRCDELNQRCDELNHYISDLKEKNDNPLIKKAEELCGRQDLKAKIIKKVIMKFAK